MVKKTILIILISFSFVLPQKKYQGVPAWYETLPVVEGQYNAAGSSKLKMESVLNAVANLEAYYRSISEGRDESFNAETKEQYETISATLSTGTLTSKLTDGRFTLESRTEDFMVESGIGQDSDIRASFEAINHLKYGTENQEYAFIQSFFKETGYGNDSKIHENFKAL